MGRRDAYLLRRLRHIRDSHSIGNLVGGGAPQVQHACPAIAAALTRAIGLAEAHPGHHIHSCLGQGVAVVLLMLRWDGCAVFSTAALATDLAVLEMPTAVSGTAEQWSEVLHTVSGRGGEWEWEWRSFQARAAATLDTPAAAAYVAVASSYRRR